MSDVEITSHGTRLGVTHLAPDTDALTGPGGAPCVVMAHGFGATRDAGLTPFAERFAATGAHVLLFDYRGFGTSDTAAGGVRQDVDHRRHREDYVAVVAAARTVVGVDPERIVLWGSSYSGGHVVAVAAKDPRVAALIAQGAAMDGFAALLLMLRVSGVRHVLRISGHAVVDLLAAVRGRAPHTIPVVALPGELAAIAAPDAESGYQAIMGPTFRNEMCARGVLRIATNRPVRSAAAVRCPSMVVVAARDNVAPPSAVRAVAKAVSGECEVLELASGHFDIYRGELLQRSAAAQAAFLTRVLTPAPVSP